MSRITNSFFEVRKRSGFKKHREAEGEAKEMNGMNRDSGRRKVSFLRQKGADEEEKRNAEPIDMSFFSVSAQMLKSSVLNHVLLFSLFS